MEAQTFSQEVLKVYSDDVVKCFRQTIKVRDYNDNSNWRKVRMALSECAMIVGNKTAPNDLEYFVLKKLLVDEFADFSPEELLVAFYKLSSGRFEVKSETYGKLSAKYLGEVLIEYRKYRHRQLSEKLREEEESNKIERASQPVENSEKIKIRKQYIEQCFIKPYQEIKSTGRIKFDRHNALMFFMMLFRRGQITIDEENKNKYRELAVESLKHDAKMEFKKTAYKELVQKLSLVKEDKDKSLEKKIKERACVLYFYDYLRQLAANGTDIRKWLEKTKMYEIHQEE